MTALVVLGCLERPVGRDQPRTTNVIVDQVVQTTVNKIDLLFVVDNSLSMADKQKILALALPDLVNRLVSPTCIDPEGNDTGTTPDSADAPCPRGAREFSPVDDIHIAVITSSLGGYGSATDCKLDPAREKSEQGVDMAHLLGSLPRGAEAAPAAATKGFLEWTSTSRRDDFVREFSNLVRESGEFGCGWEATLEAWYRFLIDPYPYTSIVRRPCSQSDTDNLCAGPAIDANGDQLVDQTILKQRAEFLRPDSLLAIIMLSDENDCSFQASGQMWHLAQTRDSNKHYYPAYRATSACSDPSFGPNHECCHSCGQKSVTPGCPTAMLDGDVVGAGCEEGRRYGGGLEDHPNLRCFQQKRRFGVDNLYPVERYSNALSLTLICPFEDDLSADPNDATHCRDGSLPVPNPLFRDLAFERDAARAAMNGEPVRGIPSIVRPQHYVYLAGIVGVPWQDVAVSPSPDEQLVYRINRRDDELGGDNIINWNWLIGERDVASTGGIATPQDPLMVESIAPRSGINPATGESLAEPGAPPMANSINGHEWNIANRDDLQYACIFPLPEEQDCLSAEAFDEAIKTGAAVPNCDCTDFGGDTFENPLCQAPDGSFDQTQRHAKAYPSLRQLQVLHDYGKNSIVASICPKEARDTTANDFGYRPAVTAIVDRLKENLLDKCLGRELTVRPNEDDEIEAACVVVEATLAPAGTAPTCDAAARSPVDVDVDPVVRKHLEKTLQCGGNTNIDCNSFHLCEITQLSNQSCLNDENAQGDGWCYVDPSKGLGSRELVEKCPATARRKLRFVGGGTPKSGSVTFIGCAGATFAD